MDERIAEFWLNNIEGIGNSKIQALLEIFGNAMQVQKATESELSQISGLSGRDVYNILSEEGRKAAENAYNKMCREGVGIIYKEDEGFPTQLREIYDCPNILYYTGTMPPVSRRLVAIVGSRKCSPYGQSMATEVARALAQVGIGIVSGMALGIDACAHRGALYAGGYTYGVLAADPTKAYPRQNYNLYMDILKSGAIISEYGPGAETVPGLFPLRNRIISGLCEATIVIEAGEHSGSLITTALALEQNRRVIALPGRISDVCSSGCNSLISQGAEVITSVEELIKSFGMTVEEDINKNNLGLAREEKMLYSLLLDFTARNIDELSSASELPQRLVQKALISLELKGFIREISKNFYVRNI